MYSLVKITPLNYDDVLNECKLLDRNNLLSIIKDCFFYIPHKAHLICQVLLDICKEDVTFADQIQELASSTCPSLQSNVSLLIYAKCLNFKVSCLTVKTIENDFFKDKEIKVENLLNINEYLNNIEMFTDQIKSFYDINEIDLFKIISIIENYQFDIFECLDELQNYYSHVQGLIGLVYLMNNSDINTFYLIMLLLRLIRDPETVNFLYKLLPMINKKQRDLLIVFIYEHFINRRINKHAEDVVYLFDSQEEINELKKFVDEDTVKEMRKFVSQQSLENFVPEYKRIYEVEKIDPIKKEDLKFKRAEDMSLDDKKTFFRDFCLLGSPSISHFLSYLEIYKEEMRMDEEEQKVFLEIFNDVFGSCTSFKRIVLDKMVKFKFLTL